MADTLGTANVRITADTSGLKKGISDAKQGMDEFANSADQAATKGATSMGKMIPGLAAIATGLKLAVDAAEKLYEALVGVEDRGRMAGEALVKSLQNGSAEQKLAAYKLQLEALNDELDRNKRQWQNFIPGMNLIGRQDDEIIAQMKQIESDQRAASARLIAEKNAALRASEELEARNRSNYENERLQALWEFQAAERKHAEDMQRAGERLNATRMQGIIDLRSAMEDLYQRQSSGFGSGDGSSSLQGGIDALITEVRAASSRIGNGA